VLVKATPAYGKEKRKAKIPNSCQDFGVLALKSVRVFGVFRGSKFNPRQFVKSVSKNRGYSPQPKKLGRPSGTHSFETQNPRLKPWAISFCLAEA
jgi:hypothetical protein